VVQGVHDAGEALFDIKEVRDETHVRVYRSIQMNLDPIGMAVQPAASMRLGHVWQPMCRLEFERLRYPHLVPGRATPIRNPGLTTRCHAVLTDVEEWRAAPGEDDKYIYAIPLNSEAPTRL
jgi:hypothetical protein